MVTRILAIPLVAVALYFLYRAWSTGGSDAIYMVPPVLGLALLYVLSPQIEWWWAVRHPPKLPAGLRRLILERSRFYQQLSVEGKQKFRERLALYMMAHDFEAKAMESVPEDAKAIAAHAAVQVTFGLDDYLLQPFEKIIFYAHPFPSPQYPKHMHASELYEPDGVLLFSVPHLIKGFVEPGAHYNIGLHEYAKALRICHPELPWPELTDESWGRLQTISGLSKDAILQYLNLPEVESIPVAVHHFFQYAGAFRQHWPEMYGMLGKALKQEEH